MSHYPRIMAIGTFDSSGLYLIYDEVEMRETGLSASRPLYPS